MKLQYISINKYGVLVDESAEIKEGDLVYENNLNQETKIYQIEKRNGELMFFRFRNVPIWLSKNQHGVIKIIFAEKELNLDAPILPDWRDWEVKREAVEWYTKKHPEFSVNERSINGFIAGYNHNKAKYTEEDLMNAHRAGQDYEKEGGILHPDEHGYIQSIQKTPKYIVMESEIIKEYNNYGSGEIFHNNMKEKLKISLNSEGKQEGIIKEIIYEVQKSKTDKN